MVWVLSGFAGIAQVSLWKMHAGLHLRMTGIDRIVLRWFCLKSNQAVILENVYLMCLCMFVPHLLSNASSTAPNWQYCGSRSAGSSKLTEIRATVRPGSAVCPTSGLLFGVDFCLPRAYSLGNVPQQVLHFQQRLHWKLRILKFWPIPLLIFLLCSK